MPPWITNEFLKINEKCWKHTRKTSSLALNFTGAILTLPSPEQAKERLKKISERYSFKHEALKADTAQTPEQTSKANLPEEAVPVDDDFVNVTYRAISAAMLADRAIDFSNEAMLKRAVGLLDGQTVFKDHETYVDNFVGRVDGTFWDTETKGLPPGINANLRLDSVKDPMTVRGVLQGALHSVSVTVSFEWKPSHPKLLDEGNFWNNLGLDVDGEQVRIVVTKIEKFWEISLVWQGADEYAKQIGADGKVVQFVAKKQASFARTSARAPDKSEENKMEILEALRKALGLEADVELTTENVSQLVGKFANSYVLNEQGKAKTQIEELKKSHAAEIVKLTTQVDALTKQIADDKAAVELGKKYLEDERQEAIRLCKSAKGENVSPAILTALEKSELAVVQAFKAEFQKEADAKFPLHCSKCGEVGVLTRQSSQTKTKEDEAAVPATPATLGKKAQSLHS